MDQITPDEARATGLEHWLNSQSRCFGDKGDVEDITEGQLIGLILDLRFWLIYLCRNS